MKIIIAPDSFKNCMCAEEACSAIEDGILRAARDAVIHKIPLADGGEGTARIITKAAGGRIVKKTVTGPLGDNISAEFGLINNDSVAVLDIASASGLELIDASQRNPMKATSYGSGELIKAALDTGVKEIVIGIGGSAVNDGGIGMLSALGFKFFDKQGIEVWKGGEVLSKIVSIDCSSADSRIKDVSIRVACDVTNPLLGFNGASYVYGPQKGADKEMVKQLDEGLSNLAEVWIKAGLASCVEQPGDGAAGGIGAALRICLGAMMEKGALIVMKYSGFLNLLTGCDLIFTGEGKTDDQTVRGKLCSVVAGEGKKKGVPVVLLSGALDADVQNLLSVFSYAVSISCGESGINEMIKNGSRNLSFAAENFMRAYLL